jgi:hypothetical protein
MNASTMSLPMPSSGIFDLSLNWALAKRVFAIGGRPAWVPDVFQLVRDGIRPLAAANNHSIILKPRQEDLSHLREWLAENTEQRYQMFGRFGFRRADEATERSFHGFRYNFADEAIAFAFAMRFSEIGAAPT